MRLVLAAILSISPAFAAESTHNDSDGCAARLERTLAEMQSRPLLKEEHATALMWLRMDAEEALDNQDEATCLRHVEIVDTLLGLSVDRD
jgi:hypothetical protein